MLFCPTLGIMLIATVVPGLLGVCAALVAVVSVSCTGAGADQLRHACNLWLVIIFVGMKQYTASC